jgi:protein-tyrosine phosphatase
MYFPQGIQIPIQEADYHETKTRLEKGERISVYDNRTKSIGIIQSIYEDNQQHRATKIGAQFTASNDYSIYDLNFYEHTIPARFDHPMVYALYLGNPIRPRMSEILSFPTGSTLYLSGLEAYTKGQKEMLNKKIQVVIAVMDSQPPPLKKYKIRQYWFKIEDSLDANISLLFSETFLILSQAIRKGENVLVHCAQGISRSVTIVAAFLLSCISHYPDWIVPYILNIASRENRTARVLEYIRTKRPIINPNPSFVRFLKELERSV